MYLLVGPVESSRQCGCGLEKEKEKAKECIERTGVCTQVLYCTARQSVRVNVGGGTRAWEASYYGSAERGT